jgi:hypothetical protein
LQGEAGQKLCHEIFDQWFFHKTTQSGPLIHGLMSFRICLRIRVDIRQSRLDKALAAFKEKINKKNTIVIHTKIWGLSKDDFWRSGVIDTVGLKVEYLCDLQAIFGS